MIAAEIGHKGTVKRLLEGGADVNHQNRVRRTLYIFSKQCTIHGIWPFRAHVAGF